MIQLQTVAVFVQDADEDWADAEDVPSIFMGGDTTDDGSGDTTEDEDLDKPAHTRGETQLDEATDSHQQLAATTERGLKLEENNSSVVGASSSALRPLGRARGEIKDGKGWWRNGGLGRGTLEERGPWT